MSSLSVNASLSTMTFKPLIRTSAQHLTLLAQRQTGGTGQILYLCFLKSPQVIVGIVDAQQNSRPATVGTGDIPSVENFPRCHVPDVNPTSSMQILGRATHMYPLRSARPPASRSSTAVPHIIHPLADGNDVGHRAIPLDCPWLVYPRSEAKDCITSSPSSLKIDLCTHRIVVSPARSVCSTQVFDPIQSVYGAIDGMMSMPSVWLEDF